jgi:hypothetical protein
LLDVDNALQLARFMGYVNSKIAREISRLHGWTDKVWSRRYQAIVVSGEDGAQIARLKYLLANGVKEGLVARPQDWPGVHVARALIQGEDLTGTWFDRTQEYAARNRGETFDRLRYASVETLHLSPLPCWKHLPEDVWRARALDLIHEIEEEAAARKSTTGSQPLGTAAILGQHPHDRPRHSKRSPAPLFHAISAKVVASSGRPTAGSSPPSGRRPRSSERETATRCFRSEAFRQPYRSSEDDLISGTDPPDVGVSGLPGERCVPVS